MRVWDVSPGYLNRQSLLGEHRELHGLYSIVTHGKKGYSRHPETLRWVHAMSGLICRHRLLAAEMHLRGYVDRTPIAGTSGALQWPDVFVTEPAGQMRLLWEKYRQLEAGRIPLPTTPQQLWAQHKYSVMARSPEEYKRIGRAVVRMRHSALPSLARELTIILRDQPSRARVANAVEHMWGHVSKRADADDMSQVRRGPAAMLACTQKLAIAHRETYLMSSTALSELAIWSPK